MKFSIVIPTYNAGGCWQDVIDGVLLQSVKPQVVYVVDSESDDDSFLKAKAAGFCVQKIHKKHFDHGGTRQMCANMLQNSQVLVFLTHDAVLADKDALKKLLMAFDDPNVGAAYGRQLPRHQANEIEKHARLFNYSDQSRIKKLNDRDVLGFKTVFISNSFAAYRHTALDDVNGFPSKTILGEDTCVVAKMLLKDWSVAYCADAQVIHSHRLSYVKEFQRYFDIGVFHGRESWIRDQFGKVGGEGRRFVRSELKYLLKKSPALIPSASVRTALKVVAYRLGRIDSCLPVALKSKLSMNKGFWGAETRFSAKLKSSITEDRV